MFDGMLKLLNYPQLPPIEFKLHHDWDMLSTKIQLAHKIQRECRVRLFFFMSLWGVTWFVGVG